MTGSSINFKPVMSANRAVLHASREVSPTYLLAENLSLGTICILDDESGVANTLAAKLALASRQALASKNFSPVWEGILNLPRPALNSKNFDAVEYKKHCVEITKSWIEEYEKVTNHKVLRADIHLDEGHIDEASGEVLLNAHAHIISDKTNEKGKVFIIDKKQMRALQTLTAEVTGLTRGKSSHETGRKHIHHDAYKAIAKANSKELDKVKASRNNFQKLFIADTPLINKLKEDIQTAESEVSKKAARIARLTELKEGYKLDRAKLKASGIATQKQYQALKIKHEADLAKLSTAESEAKKVPDLVVQVAQAQAHIAQLTPLAAQVPGLKEQVQKMDRYSENLKADLVESNRKIAAALEAKAQVIEELVRAGEKSQKLLETANGYREDAAKIQKIAADFKVLEAEIVELKAKAETLAQTHQEEAAEAKEQASELRQLQAEYSGYKEAVEARAAAEAAAAKPVPTIQAMPSLGPNARAKLRSEQMALEATRTAVEQPKAVQAGIPSPAPVKTPREAFMELYGTVKTVLVGFIDGMRLDAAEGRLGLFSSHSRTGPRVQVLCEVPEDKVMPVVGQCFDSRARPGKGGIGD